MAEAEAFAACPSPPAQELLREALTLAAEERADVAAELLASLDDPETDLANVEAVWAAEIKKRARRLMAIA